MPVLKIVLWDLLSQGSFFPYKPFLIKQFHIIVLTAESKPAANIQEQGSGGFWVNMLLFRQLTASEYLNYVISTRTRPHLLLRDVPCLFNLKRKMETRTFEAARIKLIYLRLPQTVREDKDYDRLTPIPGDFFLPRHERSYKSVLSLILRP